jgi:hypothetical protein
MPESAIPAYITSLIRHFEDLRNGTHGGSASRKDKETHFEKGGATAGSHRPPGSQRNERELAAQYWQTHRDRITTQRGWRAERILGFELARTTCSQGSANHAPSRFWKRLPSPSSSGHDSSGLAAERLQRRGCSGPAVHTPGHCVQRFA